MSSFIALALLVIMALLLLFVVNKIFPASVKIVYIFFVVIICCFMVYLLWYLIDHSPFGNTGSITQETEEQTLDLPEITTTRWENSIVLCGDEIRIDDKVIEDMRFVEEYIDQRINENITIVIVDDYSYASLHHQITDLCKKKGANIRLVSHEEWIKE